MVRSLPVFAILPLILPAFAQRHQSLDVAAFDRDRVLKAAKSLSVRVSDHDHGVEQPAQRRRRARLFFRRRLLVAGPAEPRRAVHSARRDDQPGQFYRSSPLLDAIEPASSGARRGLEADRGKALRRACGKASARMVPGRKDANEPSPEIRAGDQRACDRARHRHH